MSILLDSTILIDDLRNRPEAEKFLEGLDAKPSISVVSVLELFHGARSAKEEARIELVIADAKLLPVTEPIARLAGQFTKHYAAAHGFDELDAIIAATAEHHQLKLATLNVKHFPMFARLKRAY